SDPKVFWDKDHWVMFYFGVGKGGAHIMAAFSRDLVHWTDHPEPLYKAGGHPGGLDATYAHKISLVYNPANDTYYMYYCAVGDQGRGIGLLTSRPVVPAAPYEKTSLRASTVQAFPLSAVRLLDSPFKDAMDRDGAYLLQLEPNRLLAGFRENAGLEPKAEKYGGWERDGVAGHSLGHYLSACAMMYASTGDPRFRDRVNTIVEELKPCQDESGYVAAIPNGRKVFAEVAAGDIRSAGFDLNGCWVPWYTLHKLFAGLLDAQAYCHNDEALAIATKLGDWAIQITARLDEKQFQTMLACEHGGMNESLAELYIRTGERKYLDLSYRFHHKTVLDPLAAGEDCLPGKHGNTQIPKIIGVARRYEATGRSEDRAIAEFFWDTVVSDLTYANGGHSDNEHFGPPRKLADRLSNNTSETCNTYNMLKLTRHLFEWTGGLTYADYYEKALYNHILASQNPDDGMLCYFIPLKSGLFKTYSTPFDSFWCCVGTGMENHAKYGEGIYFHDTNRLLINLFIPSVLTWEEKGLTVQMETAYPQDQRIFLTLGCDKAVDLPLGVRCPAWAKGGFQVKVNGVPRKVESVPGAYTLIPGIWQDGDVVEIAIPMGLRYEPMPDHPERVALFYGPVLLAGDLGSIEGPEPELAPVFLAKKRPVDEWIRPIPGQPLHFLTVGVGRPVDVMLKPFYAMHHRRYGVYWDLFDEAEWAAREAAFLAEKKLIQEMEANTIDWLRIGEMQPERDHNLQGEKTGVGEFQGRKWRHASDGGWFSFEMKVDPAQAQELWCTYWGSDSGNRTFTISVDGEFLAVQKLRANRPGQFFDEIYPLPQGMLASKEKVTIRFQAAPGNFAGGLFGCRIVKTDTKE
ncbi:MAG: glycoside hydrolase family 127 protein, partial [bacterium]|nr:glycoside hydrolase family 127 protein [bacterium]